MAKTVSATVTINAAPADVWAVLCDLGRYPEWHPHIRQATGKIQAGSRVVFKMAPPGRRPFTIRPRVITAQPGAELRLLGRLPIVFSGEHSFALSPLAACAVALAANAGGSLLGRGINRDTTTAPLVTTTVSMTIGATVLLAAGAEAEGWPAMSGQAVAIIAWLAIINTAVAFTLWNFTLRHLTAGESAVVNNAMLPQIGLLGWMFLGEAPGPWQWAGMLLVAAGVVIGQRRGTAGEAAGQRT